MAWARLLDGGCQPDSEPPRPRTNTTSSHIFVQNRRIPRTTHYISKDADQVSAALTWSPWHEGRVLTTSRVRTLTGKEIVLNEEEGIENDTTVSYILSITVISLTLNRSSK